MYLEHNWLLSDEQDMSGNAKSTNSIDVTTFRDLGTGTPLYVHFLVTETFVADDPGSPSFRIQLGYASNSSLSANYIPNVQSEPYGPSDLTVGTQIWLPIARWQQGRVNTPFAVGTQTTAKRTNSKYFGINYFATDIASGKITARLSLDQGSMMTTDYYPASTDT